MNIIKGHTYSIKSRGWRINFSVFLPWATDWFQATIQFSNRELRGKDQSATVALHYKVRDRESEREKKIGFYLHTKWTSTVYTFCLGIAPHFRLGRFFNVLYLFLQSSTQFMKIIKTQTEYPSGSHSCKLWTILKEVISLENYTLSMVINDMKEFGEQD